MAYNKYYSEGKYRCNHPESDFGGTSTNPIEMKKENFVEYTHRNETANYRYDVWNGNDNVSSSYSSDVKVGKVTTLNDYSKYSERNPYNRTTTTSSKKNNSTSKAIIIFIVLIYFLPAILSVLFSIFGAIIDSL